jgi:hypothetical protein
MQSYQDQHDTNDDSNRDQLSHERRVMFLDFGLHKQIQSAANLGHCCFLPDTLIAQGVSHVLLFCANRLRKPAKALRSGSVGVVGERIGQSWHPNGWLVVKPH